MLKLRGAAKFRFEQLGVECEFSGAVRRIRRATLWRFICESKFGVKFVDEAKINQIRLEPVMTRVLEGKRPPSGQWLSALFSTQSDQGAQLHAPIDTGQSQSVWKQSRS